VTTGSFTAPIRAVNPGRFGASIDGIGEVRLELAR
jgi:2-keto-4-pentenoate hydratase